MSAPDLARVVASGACIGCGLCAGVSDAVEMVRTAEGRERPKVTGRLGAGIADDITHACPGLNVAGPATGAAQGDPVWGPVEDSFIGWAGDPAIRHQGSTGGVLSALARFLLQEGEVDFILDIAPDPTAPARSSYRISETWSDAGGSRYGPAAPLVGLTEAKARAETGQRFAVIGKPCDISAITRLAERQDWLAGALAYRLTLICGGASEFSKTANLLAGWGVAEDDLETLRYRGNGNPGPTRAALTSGETRETSYQALWEDEASWALQHRCKICADAIGMAADVVSFDVWPDANPVGEDEGFNGVLTRTARGAALVAAALDAGALVRDRTIGIEDLNRFQPHQVRKRRAVWARLVGQRAAGCVAPQTHDLGEAALARGRPLKDLLSQARGARDRLKSGKATETPP